MHHPTGWRFREPHLGSTCQKWARAHRWCGPHGRLEDAPGLSAQVLAAEHGMLVAMPLAGPQYGQSTVARVVCSRRVQKKSSANPTSHVFVAGSRPRATDNYRFHGRQIYALNLELNLLVGTCLVKKASSQVIAEYGRISGGNTRQASTSASAAVVEKLSKRDEFSWTSSISQLVRSGQHRQAVRTYEEMRGSGVKPSSHTFVAVLKACRSLQDLDTVRRIHAQVIDYGLESVVFVGNMLVDVYAKCGSLVDSKNVFEKMPHRDVVSWNSMILGCAHLKEAEVAIQMYGRMEREGIAWNDRTFVAVLKACGSLASSVQGNGADGKRVKGKTLDRVRVIHADAATSGFGSDVFVGNMLVDVYAKCGSFVDALQAFEMMPKRDVVSWNTMILGCAQMEKGQVAVQLYAQMQQQGVAPDERTFVGALKACGSIAAAGAGNEAAGEHSSKKSMALEHVRAIHGDILRSGAHCDVYVSNMLVDVYAKCGSLVDARAVFDRMLHRDVVSWTAMIAGYAQVEEGEVALQLYMQMQQEGVAPNERTFVSALKACSSLAGGEEEASYATEHDGQQQQLRVGGLERVKSIHSDIIQSRLEVDALTETMLVDAFAKCGSMVDAREVFDKMHHHDVVSWTAMITGYANGDDSHSALELYRQMLSDGVVPNDRTFMGALKACGSLAALEKGKDIHSLIIASTEPAAKVDISLASALMDMYGKCGSMGDAQQVFDALPARDAVAWNTLISGYARQGEVGLVLNACHRMKRDDGMLPNGWTFLSLLTVCSHAGLVDLGQELFAVMTRECGIAPTIDHYNCMVDLLGRAGRLDEAVEMVRAMPFPPNSVSWRSILAACQKWNCVELGQEAFRNALLLDESDAAAYVLMSNICPQKGPEVQAMRLGTRAWKKPGQSFWSDTTGIVHTFVAGGDLQHQAVFAKLEDFTSRMKE